jgi:hypothetical protein
MYRSRCPPQDAADQEPETPAQLVAGGRVVMM